LFALLDIGAIGDSSDLCCVLKISCASVPLALQLTCVHKECRMKEKLADSLREKVME
jgi:hypothetical protein